MTVELEIGIRKELHEFLQRVADQYGIAIKRIDVDWIDISPVNETKYLLGLVDIHTSARSPL